MKKKAKNILLDLWQQTSPKACALIILSSTLQAFGLYHVHSLSGITEGGSLGLNLLLDYWFAVSPAITNFVFNVICYLLGWKLLGKKFIVNSAFAVVSFSVSYHIFEKFDPLWPQLVHKPLLAALIGALFIGVNTGICVRQNAAICGDDAMAMCVSKVTGWKVQRVYLISDFTVLGLSLTYIPLKRISFSLLTVVLSGQIIGYIQRMDFLEASSYKNTKRNRKRN